MALNLEGYPNRNSMTYKELYNLKDATKILRGTLRFAGFGMIVCSFKALGLLDKEEKAETDCSWPEFIYNKVKN